MGSPEARPALARRLGLGDAVVIGLGAMLGAGVFASFGPAAAAAGNGLLIALAVAAAVAYANATSSAQLAARFPQAGGAYLYGRRCLGPVWGFVAGWGFVIGKTASCAAIALTFGGYAWPAHPRGPAVAVVVVLTAVNYRGIAKTARLSRVLVGLTLLALAVVVVAALAGGQADPDRLVGWTADGAGGIARAAALLFFAFAGYARIATLGEEVRDPARTIPRAIPVALTIVVAVYAIVGVCALAVLGPGPLAAAPAPLVAVVQAGRWDEVAPFVRVGAALACAGVLVSLMAGIGRTTLAMARDHELPAVLGAVHPRYRVPHRAELILGAIVAVLVSTADLRHAIGFSSLAVLTYYAIANAAAFALPGAQRRRLRPVASFGLLGCAGLGFALPLDTVVEGVAVLTAGLIARACTTTQRRRRSLA